MVTVKEAGSYTLMEDDGKFFLVEGKRKQSQNFDSPHAAWQALRERVINWHLIK